jgi:hypothetical protein
MASYGWAKRRNLQRLYDVDQSHRDKAISSSLKFALAISLKNIIPTLFNIDTSYRTHPIEHGYGDNESKHHCPGQCRLISCQNQHPELDIAHHQFGPANLHPMTIYQNHIFPYRPSFCQLIGFLVFRLNPSLPLSSRLQIVCGSLFTIFDPQIMASLLPLLSGPF